MLGAGAFTENFRSALNGFNRTDVVQFIQRQTVEHEKSMRLLREENARLKQAAAEPKNDARALQSELDELAQQLALCKEELATLTQQNAELNEQVDSLTQQNAELSQNVGSLETKNAELLQELSSLDSRNASLSGELDRNTAMNVELDDLNRKNGDLTAQLQAVTARNTDLSEQMTALTALNSDLRAQADILNGRITALEKQAEVAETEKFALTEALRASQEALSAAEEACEAAKATKEASPTLLDRPISAPAGLAAAPGSFDDMELAAYRRAEQTERMARERAIASSNRIQSVFRQADEKMILTAADMNQLLETMHSNCTQMQILMENARNILSESAESLKVSAELSTIV